MHEIKSKAKLREIYDGGFLTWSLNSGVEKENSKDASSLYNYMVKFHQKMLKRNLFAIEDASTMEQMTTDKEEKTHSLTTNDVGMSKCNCRKEDPPHFQLSLKHFHYQC